MEVALQLRVSGVVVGLSPVESEEEEREASVITVAVSSEIGLGRPCVQRSCSDVEKLSVIAARQYGLRSRMEATHGGGERKLAIVNRRSPYKYVQRRHQRDLSSCSQGHIGWIPACQHSKRDETAGKGGMGQVNSWSVRTTAL